MRIASTLELQDKPGQLLAALKPLSALSGNIISIVHHRDQRTSRNKIPVQIVFEIGEAERQLLLDELDKSGIAVASIDENPLIERVSVILIGHIIHTDIKDTIDCIDRTGFAEVTDISIAMPKIEGESSAYMLIEAVGKSELAEAVDLLKEIADQKDLLVIEPVRN
ncbi:amino acid-binding protein [Methanosarcinales archaeon]|nr:MAG: amino acid-binding protein [Methanosarcinales archaeon]